MNRILLALVIFASFALAPAFGADFTGKWSGDGTMNGESHPLYFVLTQQGDTLTGTGGPDSSEQHDFKSGKVDGKKIIIDIPVGEKGTLHFELEAEGDQMKGTVGFVGGDSKVSGTVTLKKATS
jgi:hypothetical protein